MITPDEQRLIEDIGHRIDLYSTALIRIGPDLVNPKTDLFIGCGTFVLIDGQFGILTAQHVAAELTSPCELGLVLMHDAHRFSIKSNHFTVCEIAIPDKPSEGPDLAFIGLYEPDVSTIRAHKQFVNIAAERESVLKNILPLSRGAWFIWGIPGERTTIEPPEGEFKPILGLHGLCAAGYAAHETQDETHDYIDIEAEYSKGFDVPKSFRGYSGGGLWQVTLAGSKDQPPTPVDFIFSGVIFYQTEVKDQKRFLHCHGRRSVYEFAFTKIKNRCT